MFELIKKLLGLEPRELSEEQREEIRGWVGDYLREAFAKASSRKEARAFAFDVLSGEMPDDELAAEIDAQLPGIEAERAAEIAGWPEVTDCDRLDAAFEELKAAGLLAEQNFWCCSTCATSDMRAALKKARKSGAAEPRGYTYYHEQDTEHAIQGHGVYLAYGAQERGEAACENIAREVIGALKRHGLEPEWDGDLDTRILVPLDWKRRTPLPQTY